MVWRFWGFQRWSECDAGPAGAAPVAVPVEVQVATQPCGMEPVVGRIGHGCGVGAAHLSVCAALPRRF